LAAAATAGGRLRIERRADDEEAMESGSLLAWLSTLSCVALGLVVGVRRERSVVATTVQALLVALALWSGGLGFANESGDGPWHAAALRMAALGMFAASGLWLLLALRQRWPRRLGGTAAMALALLPACVFFVAALTNASHGWAFRPDASWHAGLTGWAGPLTHVLVALAFGCVVPGATLFTLAAVRLWRQGERRPGLSLGLVMLAQPIVTFAALRGATGPTAVAAASLTLATLVLAITALRYSLLQPPPLGHRQVIEHLRHGVLMASATGEILDHNAAAERMLGGQPCGRSIAEAIAALASDAQRGPIRVALARVEDSLQPLSFQLESSGRRHLEVSVRPLLGDHGSPIAQIAMLRDRTEERRYAESALRTQRLETVGTLAAGIAHEVNNPLAFVRANLGEIARRSEVVAAWRGDRIDGRESKLAGELAEMGDLAQEALEGLDRIQRAVSDVRRLAAAPGTGTGAVSLDAVVQGAVRLLELRSGGRVEIRTRLAPELPEIQGSEQLLVQAVTSLLINSQQALEDTPRPWIEIETGADADAVWVRVRDNGPGIPDALRERVFEPFFTTASDSGSRGLGLTVAAGIAADHGGSLTALRCEDGALLLLRLATRTG
jgi:PAS domain S-box-containing protein